MSSRGTPRQQRSRAKRDQILDATATLLAELPYPEIGTKLIAERAGVSVGSLYRYFADKDEIARALVLHWLDRMITVLDGALADPPPAAGDLVDRVVDAFARFYRSEPGFHQVWFFSGPAGHLDRAVGDAHDAALATRLRAALATPRYRIDVSMRRARIAVSIGDKLLSEAFRDDPDGDREIVAELKVVLRGYLLAADRSTMDRPSVDRSAAD
ncbi:TetR family transcriptional regulator [Actinocatenispora thailandica]|uniref:TetR family transcriptional regulator n=1 Tax=Actinocatenispora thailandica TaxID=227318 RepID=A0A7R7DN73_9ACTN|nr:TetR family transcriptional regulator [Actinocatenispora thailandica]BCJ34606.1 TetR family transcriptional regulator [Actinocatenispora thailandica]